MAHCTIVLMIFRKILKKIFPGKQNIPGKAKSGGKPSAPANLICASLFFQSEEVGAPLPTFLRKLHGEVSIGI